MASMILEATLRPIAVQEITLSHGGGEVLHVGERFGQLCAWFSCDLDKPEEAIGFRILITGEESHGDEDRYLGTVSVREGQIPFLAGDQWIEAKVFHIFKMKKA